MTELEGVVTTTAVEATHLGECLHRIRREACERGAVPPLSAAVRRRIELAEERQAEVLAALQADGGELTVIEPGPRAVARTAAALRRGDRRIWGAVLPPSAGRRGRADLLLVAPGGGYVPVIVVAHLVTDPRTGADFGAPARLSVTAGWDPRPDGGRRRRRDTRDVLRLAHLVELLQDAGYAPGDADGTGGGRIGGVIGREDDRAVLVPLEDELPGYRAKVAAALAVLRGEGGEAPSRIGRCRECPWWETFTSGGREYEGCRERLEQERDVSLVVTGRQAELLRARGVCTVDELAADPGRPSGWRGDPSYADAVVLARVRRDGRIIAPRAEAGRGTGPRRGRGPAAAGAGAIGPVRRADVEVDVDLESYLELGAYLWGAVLAERGPDDDEVVGPGEYHAFVTWEPLPAADEARSFAEFWGWLMDVRGRAHAEGRTFGAYCYSRSAENRWLLASARRFAGLPGVPSEGRVRAFISSPEWVDVFAAVEREWVVVGGRGLKTVARACGFDWRDPEAGGEESMDWYRQAVGWAAAPPGGPDAARRRILEYNDDDCRATRVVRDALTDGRFAAP